jgi:hypothetical protein
LRRPRAGYEGDGREEWTHDEESVDELNGDTLAAVFFGEGAAPGYEECFAAGVGGQHGRGNFARKGTNVQDQTVLPERETKLNNKIPGKKCETSVLGEHERQDELGDSQSAVNVDLQDVVDFLLRCLVEIDGDVVRAANIVHCQRPIRAPN